MVIQVFTVSSSSHGDLDQIKQTLPQGGRTY
jgi:hypothetical protein